MFVLLLCTWWEYGQCGDSKWWHTHSAHVSNEVKLVVGYDGWVPAYRTARWLPSAKGEFRMVEFQCSFLSASQRRSSLLLVAILLQVVDIQTCQRTDIRADGDWPTCTVQTDTQTNRQTLRQTQTAQWLCYLHALKSSVIVKLNFEPCSWSWRSLQFYFVILLKQDVVSSTLFPAV